MTPEKAIAKSLEIYEGILPDEIKKDPQKIHAIVSIANLLLNRGLQKFITETVLCDLRRGGPISRILRTSSLYREPDFPVRPKK